MPELNRTPSEPTFMFQSAIGALMDDPQRALYEPLVSSFLDCGGVTSNDVMSLINAVSSFPASEQCNHAAIKTEVLNNAPALFINIHLVALALFGIFLR